MPNHHVPTNAVAQILRSILSPIRQFLQLEAAGGIVLLVVTVFTLIWANSTYGDVYFHLLHLPIGFQFGPFILQKSLQHWVNDGLMVIFFFVVGLEIKKEFIAGELSDLKRAALPIVGALGGMVAPALIYAAFNVGTDTAHGWGIPMATDIAFAVGVLTLLGKRVPFSLLVFLLALAIADDLGAVLVIAFFYTADLSIVSLGYAALAAGATLFLQQAGVRSRFVYFLLAIVLWYAILKSHRCWRHLGLYDAHSRVY
jgi:NhaA family Na+:H+ antiporter